MRVERRQKTRKKGNDCDRVWKEAESLPYHEPQNMRALYDEAQAVANYACGKCQDYNRDRADGAAITIIWPSDTRTHVHAHKATEALWHITLRSSQPQGDGGKHGGTRTQTED